MATLDSLSRRSFLSMAGTAAAALSAPAAAKKPIIGLELYSVRDEMSKDLFGTVKRVAKMGYEGVEFYSPYFDWTMDYTKEVRKLLDDLNVKCLSTHNGAKSFEPANLQKAIDMNQVLGSKFIVMASAGRVENIDAWKGVAERLQAAAEKFKPAGMTSGFHNHQTEFKQVDGKRPIEILAANTSKDVVLQLDIGTCVEVGYDPVEWINKNAGRIRSMHVKEWSSEPGKGYKVLFGEGNAPWKKIFAAAEKKGGVEHYLIEQEGASVPSFEAVEKCLASFKKMRA